ncbi:Copia protein, partial [Termitomyces sp. J132]
DQWHQIFGHMHMPTVKLLKSKNMVEGMDIDGKGNKQQCKICIWAKYHVTPFPKESGVTSDQIRGIEDGTSCVMKLLKTICGLKFSDADWEDSPDNWHSISDYVAMICGRLAMLSSRKQPTIALSSMEAEYMALYHATYKISWICLLLTKLGHSNNSLTVLITNNQSAITFASNAVFCTCRKHINI